MESLSDEILLRIVKLAADQRFANLSTRSIKDHWEKERKCHCGSGWLPCKYDHEFIVNVLSQISRRFNRVSRDQSLWEDEGCGLKLLRIPIRDVPPKTTLESLPEELLMKIVKAAAFTGKVKTYKMACANPCYGCLYGTCSYDHEFVANTVSEISMKFNRIAKDGALWREDKSMMVFIRHGSASF